MQIHQLDQGAVWSRPFVFSGLEDKILQGSETFARLSEYPVLPFVAWEMAEDILKYLDQWFITRVSYGP